MTNDSISNEDLAGIINAGFSGIEERMATKDDLAAVRSELKADVAGVDRRLGSLEGAVGDLGHRMGSLEESTGNLERRLCSMESMLADVKDSVESLERSTSDTYDLLSGRVTRVERHLGLPHVQADTPAS